MDEYKKILEKSDIQIRGQFNALIKRAQEAFSTTLWMHRIIFGIGVVIMAFGLYVAVSEGFKTFESYIGIGTVGGSLSTLLLLFYTNPTKNISVSVQDLARVDVVFSGYVRQINQIDATFRQLFLESVGSSKLSLEEMKHTVEQIQSSVKNTLEHMGRAH